MSFPSVVDVMSGAGDAAIPIHERGGEEEEEEEGAAEMPVEGGSPRDSHVAAITFWGALKIPVRNLPWSSIGLKPNQ